MYIFLIYNIIYNSNISVILSNKQMRNMSIIEIVGIFIIIIVVAVLIWWNLFRSAPPHMVTGGVNNGFNGGAELAAKITAILGGGNSDVVEKLYTLTAPTLSSVGEIKNIEQYLGMILDVPSVEISEYTRGRDEVPLAHKKYYELLIIAADSTMPRDECELMAILDLRYCWFLSGDKGKLLTKSRPSKPLYNELINKIITEEMDKLNITDSALKNKLSSRFTKLGAKYKCFTIDISTLSAKQLAKKLTQSPETTVGLDTVTIRCCIRNFLLCHKNLSTISTPLPSSYSSVADKLNAVDLIDMYPREPYLVKSFVERIKREIDLIEYNTNYWKNILPLGSNALRVSLRQIALRDEELPRWERKNNMQHDAEGPLIQFTSPQIVMQEEVPYAPEKVNIAPTGLAVESKMMYGEGEL